MNVLVYKQKNSSTSYRNTAVFLMLIFKLNDYSFCVITPTTGAVTLVSNHARDTSVIDTLYFSASLETRSIIKLSISVVLSYLNFAYVSSFKRLELSELYISVVVELISCDIFSLTSQLQDTTIVKNIGSVNGNLLFNGISYFIMKDYFNNFNIPL